MLCFVRIGTVGDCCGGVMLPRWVDANGEVSKSESSRATSSNRRLCGLLFITKMVTYA